MGSPSVVVGRVLGQDQPQMPFAEDQHPVGDLGPGGEHEAFRKSIRSRAARRDLHGLDTGAGQDRVKRCGELPGPVADQEPQVRGAFTQIHQQVADLLSCPRPVRIRGHAEEVHVTAADLHDEQAVQPLQRHCAVHVEEISGEHRRCLGAQELPPRRVGVPLGRRGDLQGLEDPADGGRTDPVTELEQLALDPLVSQPLFSVASRSISAAISALAGGRPVRCG